MREKVEQLVDLLGACSSEVLTAHLLDDLTAGQVTPVQLEALSFIDRHREPSVKALAEGLRTSIPSATRLVDRLVRKALVSRRESEVDRRLVELNLTEAGRTMLHQLRRERVARLQHALDTFDAREREVFIQYMDRFLLAMLRDARMAAECCRHCGADHDGACVVNIAHLALAGQPIAHP